MIFTVLHFCGEHWRRQPAKICGMAALIVAGTMLEACVPLLIGGLISASTQQAFDAALRIGGLFVVAIAISALARYACLRLLVGSTMSVMSDMTAEAFRNTLSFTLDWHTKSRPGSTVRSISRGVWSYDSMADIVLLGFLPTLVVASTSVLLLWCRWPVVGFAALAFIVAYLTSVLLLITRYVAPAARVSSGLDSELNGELSDVLSCNFLVKIFAGEAREILRMEGLLADWRRSMEKTWRRYIATGLSQNIASAMVQISAIGFCLYLIREKHAGSGDLAYLLTAVALVNGYLRDISGHIRGFLRAASGLEPLRDLSCKPAARVPAAAHVPVPQGDIEFRGVAFGYDVAGEPLYRALDVTIAQGSKVALVGPSGGGKSTFVKLLLGLYEPDSGEILIGGRSIHEMDTQSLRQAVAVVPQDPQLLHRTIRENIAYARPGASLARVIDSARRSGADEFISTLPLGYDTPVGDKGVRISGGERQRIALARAFLSEASIVVLDEATSNLDVLSEQRVQDSIRADRRERTVITIAHRLDTIRDADQIIVFERGVIAEKGSHVELAKCNNGIYSRMLAAQTGSQVICSE